MNRFLPIPLLLTLAVPAQADGAMDLLLLVATGGPLAAVATSAWGLHRSREVAPGWPCYLAATLSVIGAVGGYWHGIRLGDYRVNQLSYAGAVAFWGPLAVFFSALLARIPSLVLSKLFPTGKAASAQSEIAK